jgi:hypothetical protein
MNHPCIDCNEDDYIVLEFDHIKGHKLYNVATLINTGMKQELIKQEIKKCEAVCCNCHGRRTYARGRFVRTTGE